MVNNQAIYYFHEGTNYQAYSYFGVHTQGDGLVFRTYAPHAKTVSVVGDFNHWNPEANPLTLLKDSGGVWEGTTPFLERGAYYKFAVQTSQGEILYKADPYATYAQTAGETASVYYPLEEYAWQDAAWMLS